MDVPSLLVSHIEMA